MRYSRRFQLLLWIFAVYTLSFLCYLPLWLERRGMAPAGGLINLKYLFVCIPAILSALLLMGTRNLKVFLKKMFSGRIAAKQLLILAGVMAGGGFSSWAYGAVTGENVLQRTYPSVITLLVSGIYLFATALVEETAWRGFLLERLSAKGESSGSILLTGVLWAGWHLPMWRIRNELGIGQILVLVIWTVLVSVILGEVYFQCRNILLIAALHASFNIAYLAPVQYHIIVLAMGITAGVLVRKKRLRAG